MAIESRTPEPGLSDGVSEARAEKLARAEGRLSLLRSYFGFQAYAGVVVGALIVLSPIIGHTVTIHGKPWITLPALAVSTWAAFRTRRLLAERERDGAWMAGATFGCNLLAAASAGQFGTGIVFSGFGVLLALNVYRHLQDV